MKELKQAHEDFKEHAENWKTISELFMEIGETKDEKYLNQASELLLEISEKERKTMTSLMEACRQ